MMVRSATRHKQPHHREKAGALLPRPSPLRILRSDYSVCSDTEIGLYASGGVPPSPSMMLGIGE